jgi:hypothetical protein
MTAVFPLLYLLFLTPLPFSLPNYPHFPASFYCLRWPGDMMVVEETALPLNNAYEDV